MHGTQRGFRDSRVNELINSNADLRATIDIVPELAWCNRPDGSIEFTNRRWHDYTGQSSQEAHSGMEGRDSSGRLVRIDRKVGCASRPDKPAEFKCDCDALTGSTVGFCFGVNLSVTQLARWSDGMRPRLISRIESRRKRCASPKNRRSK